MWDQLIKALVELLSKVINSLLTKEVIDVKTSKVEKLQRSDVGAANGIDLLRKL